MIESGLRNPFFLLKIRFYSIGDVESPERAFANVGLSLLSEISITRAIGAILRKCRVLEKLEKGAIPPIIITHMEYTFDSDSSPCSRASWRAGTSASPPSSPSAIQKDVLVMQRYELRGLISYQDARFGPYWIQRSASYSTRKGEHGGRRMRCESY